MTHSVTRQTTEQRARSLVAQEVEACLSSLVSTLTTGYGAIEATEGLGELVEQAFELASPIPDYEEAATQEGWSIVKGEFRKGKGRTLERAAASPADACGWENLCNEFDIEPYDREVFEHWAVSYYLGRKLKAAGEKVDDDFAGMVVWARTTTGQAIYADGVIERIAADLMKGA